MSVLSGGAVFGSATDDLTDLRNLVDEIGARSFAERIGGRSLPDAFDATAWRHPGGSFYHPAVQRPGVRRRSGRGRRGAAVTRPPRRVRAPVAETDVLAALAGRPSGPRRRRRPHTDRGHRTSMQCPMRARRPLSCWPCRTVSGYAPLCAPRRICRSPRGTTPHGRTPRHGGDTRRWICSTVDAARRNSPGAAHGRAASWSIGALDAAVELLRRAHPRTRAVRPSAQRLPVRPAHAGRYGR